MTENKIRVTKGINIQRVVDEVKGRLSTIFNDFNSIKVEYPDNLEK